MNRTLIATAVLLVLLCGAPVRAAAPAADVGGIDVYADGARLHLLVGRRGAKDAAPTLEYRSSDDGGVSWSKPSPLGAGLPAPYRVETGDLQLAAHGRALLAVWSAKGTGP